MVYSKKISLSVVVALSLILLTNSNVVYGSFLHSDTIPGLDFPASVAIDSAGNVYVTESGLNQITVFDSAGSPLTPITGLNFPVGLTIDSSDNIFVADLGSNSILKITGGVSSVFVSGLVFPSDVAIDSAGNVYVANSGNNQVSIYDSTATLTSTLGDLLGLPGSLNNEFNFPISLAVNSDFLLVVDQANSRVQIFEDDVVPPVITVPSDQNECMDVDSQTWQFSWTVTATDNSGAPTVTQTAGPSSPALFPAGLTTITYEAEDAAGNTATKSFTVFVNDCQPPSITAPADITVNTDPGLPTAVVNFLLPIATDNADPNPAVVVSSALLSGSAFPIGTSTVEFTATDGSGNFASASFTITVEDHEDPVLTVPSSDSRCMDTNSSTWFNSWTVTATDNSGAPTVTQTAGPSSPALFPAGLTTITYEAEDAAGNTATKSFTFSVSDCQPPSITAPADITVNTDPGEEGATVTYPDPTVSDNAPGVTFECAPPSGSFFDIGDSLVTCTATQGDPEVPLTAEDTFTITVVVDNEPPVIIPPDNIIVNNDPGFPGATVTYPDPTVSDNSGSVTFECAPPSDSFFDIGTTTIICGAVDAIGNFADESFTITVNDNEEPEIFVSTDIQVLTDPGLPTAVVIFDLPAVSDNSGVPVTVEQTAGLTSGSAFPIGTTTNTFEAEDSSGNTASASFDVTVIPRDTDGDGVADLSDVCEGFDDNIDTDSDGTPDGCDSDDDNDGISDDIDLQPATPSNDFDDGTTFGAITSGNQFLTIIDIPNGVNISSTGDATVDVCGIATLFLTDGNSVDVQCGSITLNVVTGTLQVEFVTDDGTTVTSTLDSGSNVTFDATEITLTNNGSTDVELIVDGKPVTIPSGESIIVSQSLLEQKSSVIETLMSLKGSDDKLDKKIDKVIKHITKATDEKFWEDDGESLEDKKSKKIFDEEKKAVKGLMKIVKKGNSGIDAEISDVIAILVDVDRELAQDAINEAKAFEGDKKVDKEIEKAEKELSKGDKEVAKGKFDKAIDKYKKAWEHAQKALKKKK